MKKSAGRPIQLKDAFDMLAKASGFKSWRELKELFEATDHFFICDQDYIQFLGVPITDVDLKNVGRNWVEPNDAEAFFRLTQKIRANTAG